MFLGSGYSLLFLGLLLLEALFDEVLPLQNVTEDGKHGFRHTPAVHRQRFLAPDVHHRLESDLPSSRQSIQS